MHKVNRESARPVPRADSGELGAAPVGDEMDVTIFCEPIVLCHV
jgi:hypothetical protein